MHWWVITVVCLCGSLLVQYMCSSKLLRMKQAISIKTISLHDARSEGSRLDEQENDLQTQQASLTNTIERLRKDIVKKREQLAKGSVQVPTPSFPLEDPGEDPGTAEA
jgi:hypothetical protein